MKKFIYGILGLAAISLVSCDYHDPNDGKFESEPSTGWVQFEQDGVSYLSVVQGTESTVQATIPVVIRGIALVDLNGNIINGTVVNEGLTVYYTVEDVDGSSSFINIPGSVYIPKGELSANISFTVPASSQVSCTEFKVTLTSTSNSNVTVGFEDNNISTQTFVVGAYDLNAMVGTYNAVRDGDTQYQCNITLGEEPNSLIVSNVYGIAPSSQTTIYVNEDGTISYPDYSDNFLLVNGGDNIYVDGLDGLSTCLNGGTIALDIRLRSDGTIYDPNSIVLTKQ